MARTRSTLPAHAPRGTPAPRATGTHLAKCSRARARTHRVRGTPVPRATGTRLAKCGRAARIASASRTAPRATGTHLAKCSRAARTASASRTAPRATGTRLAKCSRAAHRVRLPHGTPRDGHAPREMQPCLRPAPVPRAACPYLARHARTSRDAAVPTPRPYPTRHARTSHITPHVSALPQHGTGPRPAPRAQPARASSYRLPTLM
jgi:hypothetical protein